ncbi:MAG: GIY-YIG nuclease family protein [Bacteroidetes bacterium]|nr:GIY-YIG nuclease family protein [Bacteroidota bacterium]
MVYLYILYSEEAGKFYIGHTSESVEERLRKHLSDHSGFTSKFKDWKVVYSESYPDKSAAYRRELELKGWKSSKRIRKLVQSIPSFQTGGSQVRTL